MNNLPDVFPRDRYNDILISNVHPPDWENPEPLRCYNLGDNVQDIVHRNNGHDIVQ